MHQVEAAEARILEGIVTTLNEDGTPNVSPMGPYAADDMRRLVFRPFATSQTYVNLCRVREGVFHVTDDVEMLARAAVNRLCRTPELMPAKHVQGVILAGACRWYEFRVTAIDGAQERTRIEADTVHCGRIRDFFGFNRAKHAVLEAAILATRVHILPANSILSELERLRAPVEKTAASRERRAFDFLCEYIDEALREGAAP